MVGAEQERRSPLRPNAQSRGRGGRLAGSAAGVWVHLRYLEHTAPTDSNFVDLRRLHAFHAPNRRRVTNGDYGAILRFRGATLSLSKVKGSQPSIKALRNGWVTVMLSSLRKTQLGRQGRTFWIHGAAVPARDVAVPPPQ